MKKEMPYLWFSWLPMAADFHERALSVLYEPSQPRKNESRRFRKNAAVGRDISEYQVNEPAPTDGYFQNILKHLLALAAQKPGTLAIMRRYIGQWACWLKLGLSTIEAFETSVQLLLPGIFSCWTPGSEIFNLGR